MSTETIADLRTHLFSALRGLTDKENPMDIERAKAVSDVAQTIINSAKVEVEHLKVAGGKGSGFIPDALPALPGMGADVVHQGQGVTVRRHVLK
jgi:hypothetical protein